MRYLAFCPIAYGFDIMRPLQAEARRRGQDFAWFTLDGLHEALAPDERRVASLEDALAFAPDAVFSPVHWVPHQLPGAKVQVFHGFDLDKHGRDDHFRLRGGFDLLLTQGPSTTTRFAQMAEQLGYFEVVETGWAKLDPLFDPAVAARPVPAGKPVILYASTFSRRVNSIAEMLPALQPLMRSGRYHWLLSTHPKTDPSLVEQLRDAARLPGVEFVREEPLIPVLKAADVMLCDTSSIVYEFLLQEKPAITLRNLYPGPHLIDMASPTELPQALEQALAPSPALREAITTFGQHIHPARDAGAAARSLDAVARHLAEFSPRRPKPLGWWRRRSNTRKLQRGLRGN